MLIEYWLGAAVTLGLLVYLVYALLRPERFPRFAEAIPIVEILRPGETLFIPCGVWHTARSRTVSISVAFDQLCRSNWRFFTREVRRTMYPSPVKSTIVAAMLGVIGAALTVGEQFS